MGLHRAVADRAANYSLHSARLIKVVNSKLSSRQASGLRANMKQFMTLQTDAGMLLTDDL